MKDKMTLLGKKVFKIKILGTEYSIKESDGNMDPKLMGANGYVELYSKEIIIAKKEIHLNNVNNLRLFREKVLRHEMFHALFHEAGLKEYSSDEILIEFLAIQAPKITNILKELENLDLLKDELEE